MVCTQCTLLAYDLAMRPKKLKPGESIFQTPYETRIIVVSKKKKPEKLSLGPVVAERSFALFQRDGTPVQVSVRLGTPSVGRKSKVPGHDEYRCPVQIVGIGRENMVVVWGEDPFVALQHAIDYIGLRLDILVRKENLEIRFRSSRSGWIWRYPPH